MQDMKDESNTVAKTRKEPIAGEVISLDIPSQYGYLSLALCDGEDGRMEYNQSLISRLLRHNGYSFRSFSDEDIFNLIHYWYMHHLAIGGSRDQFSDTLFDLSEETGVLTNVVVESPSGESLKDLRLTTGISQVETSRLLGLSSRQLISDYERGVKKPSDQVYTLWLLLSGEHPDLKVIKKEKKVVWANVFPE